MPWSTTCVHTKRMKGVEQWRLMVGTNFIYVTAPHRANQTTFQSHGKKKKEKSRRGKRVSLSLPPVLFFTLFLSHPSPPFCSVFRLSSLREWDRIKDLIKTPEQAKALWQRAKLSSARTGSAGRRLSIRPRELGYELGD